MRARAVDVDRVCIVLWRVGDALNSVGHRPSVSVRGRLPSHAPFLKSPHDGSPGSVEAVGPFSTRSDPLPFRPTVPTRPARISVAAARETYRHIDAPFDRPPQPALSNARTMSTSPPTSPPRHPCRLRLV